MGLLGNLFTALTGSNQGASQVNVQALMQYRKAAERGDVEAQYMMGVTYHGHDYVQAMIWFNKAANQGHADAQAQLGKLYANGLGTPRNFAQAAIWLRKAADQGVIGAQGYLGSMYADGSGVIQDYVKAMMWFSIIKSTGSILADRDLRKLEAKATTAQIAEAKRMAQEWRNAHL